MLRKIKKRAFDNCLTLVEITRCTYIIPHIDGECKGKLAVILIVSEKLLLF
ncbi:MAG: hypothetical protein RR540_01875 [Oscillospiraceae bacterium]